MRYKEHWTSWPSIFLFSSDARALILQLQIQKRLLLEHQEFEENDVDIREYLDSCSRTVTQQKSYRNTQYLVSPLFLFLIQSTR